MLDARCQDFAQSQSAVGREYVRARPDHSFQIQTTNYLLRGRLSALPFFLTIIFTPLGVTLGSSLGGYVGNEVCLNYHLCVCMLFKS